MLHFLCFFLGTLTIIFEVLNIDTDILFQYSGWFVIFTSLLHLIQMLYSIPSFLAYVCLIIGMLIVLPASVPSLASFDDTLASYLFYGVGGHIFLPLCTVFHLNKTSYSNITKSIVFLIFYNITWVFFVEYFSIKKPYKFLDDLMVGHRILSYIIISFVGVFGLLILSLFSCISRNNTIYI